MSVNADELARLQRTTGIVPLATGTGLDALANAVALPNTQLLVMAGDIARISALVLPEVDKKPGESEEPRAEKIPPKTVAEKAVVENGGHIVRETFEFPGGRRFHFRDPAGHELAIWSDK